MQLDFAHADQDAQLNDFVNILQNVLGGNYHVTIQNGAWGLNDNIAVSPSVRISMPLQHNDWEEITAGFPVTENRTLPWQGNIVASGNITLLQLNNILTSIRNDLIDEIEENNIDVPQNVLDQINNIGGQQHAQVHQNVNQNLNQNNINQNLLN